MAITYLKHRSGYPIMYPWTPVSAVSAGDVITTGNTALTARVCHQAIAAGEVGELAMAGGVYNAPKSSADGITAGDYLYWNPSANQMTPTYGAGYAAFGLACNDCVIGTTTVDVMHWPEPLAQQQEEESASSSSSSSTSSASSASS